MKLRERPQTWCRESSHLYARLGHCRRGRTPSRKRLSRRCVRTRKRARGSCGLCWRRNLATPARLTTCRRKPSSAFFGSRRKFSLSRWRRWESAMVEAGTLPKGTQPEGATSEQDASRKVREMFTRIAPRYDLLNHLLSGQMDKRWRGRTARELRPILERADGRVLDLCCGTGDLAFSLARNGKARITGADFSHTMLVRARAKAVVEANGSAPLPFFEADALRLPFADGSFDLITTAFGFRNLANYEAGLREMFRVLKPGGTVAILEFTGPAPGFIGDAYRFYCQRVLPKIGGLISGDAAAYAYLPKSVARFFHPNELAGLMPQGGYGDVRIILMMLKSVSLHIRV